MLFSTMEDVPIRQNALEGYQECSTLIRNHGFKQMKKRLTKLQILLINAQVALCNILERKFNFTKCGVTIMIEINKDKNSQRDAEIHYVPTGNDIIIVDHTFVSDRLRGQGVGQELVRKVVQFARKDGIKIMPLCPFAKSQFDQHKDYDDVLLK
jgi:predicted GNAT family acetyltransferase